MSTAGQARLCKRTGFASAWNPHVAMTDPAGASLPLTNSARRHRGADPRTSVEAARRAAKASLRAMWAVECLMRDHGKRIDEEICSGCRMRGYIASPETVRHGRLALSESGVVVATGATRRTSLGLPSREWVLASPNPLRLWTNGRDYVVACSEQTASAHLASYSRAHPNCAVWGDPRAPWNCIADDVGLAALELVEGVPLVRTQLVLAWVNEKGSGYLAGQLS